MARQSKAQRDYIRNIRTHNSINYFARTTKPRGLRNIDIIMKTMEYNELDDNPNSPEAKKVKMINTGLLIFTVLFEVIVVVSKTMAFMCTIGKKRCRYL